MKNEETYLLLFLEYEENKDITIKHAYLEV